MKLGKSMELEKKWNCWKLPPTEGGIELGWRIEPEKEN